MHSHSEEDVQTSCGCGHDQKHEAEEAHLVVMIKVTSLVR
jgi:hypothetical protein